MKTKQLIVLLISVVILTIAATFIYYSYSLEKTIVKTEIASYSFRVQKHVGLVGDRDAIKFGGILPGGTGSRYISFRNDFEFPVNIKITVKGEKNEWITTKENNFILEPNTTKEVKITVIVPEYAESNPLHNYTGTVTAYHLKI